MRTLVFFLLAGFFSSVFCANFGEIIYVSKKITWSKARAFCRQYYTDLTSVNSQKEIDELFTLVINIGNDNNKGWIGLYKDANGTWTWSGGKDALLPLLETLQETAANHSCVIQSDNNWKSANCQDKYPFYCFQSSLALVRENKSWEAAMEHCRSLDMQLVSTSSESALNQVLQTSRTASTAQVWTGLRYLGEGWLWVDGTCAGDDAWCQEGMPQCPASSHHCGALSLEGQQLGSWDCADKLNFVCYSS